MFLKLFFTVTIAFIFLNLLLMDICISILLRATMDRFKIRVQHIYIHIYNVVFGFVSCRLETNIRGRRSACQEIARE